MSTQRSLYARALKYDPEVLSLLVSRANVLGLDESVRQAPRSSLDVLLEMKKSKYPYVEKYGRSTHAVEDYGRLYPMYGGVAYLHRPARGALLHRFYHDLDMVNSIPNIAIQYARKNYNVDLETLRSYVDNRDAIHARIIADLGFVDEPERRGIVETARDQAKCLVNAVMNGKGLQNIRSPWLHTLKTQMHAFAAVVSKDPKHAALLQVSQEREKSLQSFLSLILQREEAKVLVAMDAALTAHGRVPTGWIYDGLCVEKATEGEPTLPDDIVAGVESAVKAATGYTIRLKVKPFAPYTWLADALATWRSLSPIERVIGQMTMTGAESPIREVTVSHRYVADAVNDDLVKDALLQMAGGDEQAFATIKTTFVIKSHLGTGKTTQAMEWIRAHKEHRVLVISARRTFTRFIMGDLDALKHDGIVFHAYDERTDTHESLAEHNYVVVQVESLWRLEDGFKDYDFVVVDESESILNQFHSFETHKDKLLRNFKVFEKCVRNAHRVLFADAFITTRTLIACANLRDAATSLYINNTFNPYKRTATRLWLAAKESSSRLAAFDEFCKRIARDLRDGKRVAVVWTSLTAAKLFVKAYLPADMKNEEWRLYSSESRKSETAELGDVATNWRNLRLLMYTTAITIGVNYNPVEDADCFDRVYLYACSRTALPRDIAQALLRCRRIRTNELVYTIDISSPPKAPYCIDTIRADFSKRRAMLENANPIVQWKESPKWVEDNFCLNERESALRSYVYAETLNDYLIQSGYSLSEVEVARVEGDSIKKDAKTNAVDVPIIEAWEAESIRLALIDREATPLDRLALQRFNIYKQLKPETKVVGDDGDVNTTAAADVWRAIYDDTDRVMEPMFWNIVNEKHNTPEEYAAREAGRKYVEMAHNRLARRVVLAKVLPILGMENTCAGKSFEVTDAMAASLAPLEEDVYKHFSAKGLSRRKKGFGASHAVDLITAVFNAWGIEVESATTRKQAAGKRANVFTMNILKQPMWDLITDKDMVDTLQFVED